MPKRLAIKRACLAVVLEQSKASLSNKTSLLIKVPGKALAQLISFILSLEIMAVIDYL